MDNGLNINTKNKSGNLPIHLAEDESSNSLDQKLLQALSHKQAVKFMGSNLSMLSIGG